MACQTLNNGTHMAQVRSARDLVSVATRDASCPMCRTRIVAGAHPGEDRGVYEGAVELRHVDLLIQQRWALP